MTRRIRLIRRMSQIVAGGGWVGLALITAARLGAQTGPPKPPLTNEARFDTRISRHNVVEAGWSLIIPTGIYVRSSLTAAGGYVWRDQRWARESRYEATSRFLLDPFRQSRFGLSVGGGIGMTNSDGFLSEPNALGDRSVRWRPYLAAILDMELRKTAGWTPAVQVGLGGGFRAGLMIRSSTNRWR